MDELLRVYDADECGERGYPFAWTQGDLGVPAIKDLVRERAGHRCVRCGHPYVVGKSGIMDPPSDEVAQFAREMGISQLAMDLGLELAADRMVSDVLDFRRSRRKHWSPCDERCTHRGPYRYRHGPGDEWFFTPEDEPWIGEAGIGPDVGIEIQALWRILTVHHLDGNKANCCWWNLAALCQRCHLTVQGKVQMARVWPWEHSAWFQPYVAGYYAAVYLGEDLTRAEVDARLGELLDLERVA